MLLECPVLRKHSQGNMLPIVSALVLVPVILQNSNALSEKQIYFSKESREILTNEAKHLRLIGTPILGFIDMERNSTGHVISSGGTIPQALDWLSKCYNFTFSFLPMNGTVFIEDLPDRRGALSYLRSKEAEMIVGALIPSTERFKSADFTMPWIDSPFSLLIPIPNSSVNIAALIQPMQAEVWIGIVLTVPIVAAILYGLNIFTFNFIVNRHKNLRPKNRKKIKHEFQVVGYVIRVLLSQGGYCGRKNVSIRLGAAAWCLGCFVLVQAYSSTLISFITLPNRRPIINSIYDIPNVPGLDVTANRNFAADVTIMNSNHSVLKTLRKALIANPSLRCNVTESCIENVRKGNHVYMHADQVIKRVIAMDREKTGTCHFTRARETFWAGNAVFALGKMSPYTERVSQGILRMSAAGLIQKWNKDFNKEPTECLRYNKKHPGISRLSLRNFTSAYIIIIVGVGFSVFFFLVELISKRF